MQGESIEARIWNDLHSGEFPSLFAVARRHAVSVNFVREINNRGPHTTKEQYSRAAKEREAREQLLRNPDARILREVYGGDLERYRRVVEANFPDRGAA